MRVIGITGGIGTGKSTILNLLKTEYDAYIVETDKLAHTLMLPGNDVYETIVEVFGTDILNEDRTIHRGLLGQIVFKNKELLGRLNNIVHPAVKNYIISDIAEKKQKNTVSYYIIEAALLIEDGYKQICDEMWYVYASEEIRIQRLLSGRGADREKWLQVIANQSSEDYYRKHCDVVIDNSGKVEQTAGVIKGLLCK